MNDRLNDVELARHIAETAGALLLTLQQSGLFAGKALGKAGDRTANAFIMEALAANRPEDAVLSEEEAADPARLGASRVWIVDPLDGTREYGERRTDWAVHIALAIDGAPVIRSPRRSNHRILAPPTGGPGLRLSPSFGRVFRPGVRYRSRQPYRARPSSTDCAKPEQPVLRLASTRSRSATWKQLSGASSFEPLPVAIISSPRWFGGAP